MKNVRSRSRIAVAVFFVAASSIAQTLTWNPAAPESVWDSTTENWFDGATPSAWVPGADAIFPAGASGTMIEVAEDLTAASVTFASGASGVTLAGQGRLRVAAVTVLDAAATNSVATELFALDGLAVAGPGAVALGRVSGPVTLASGTLLAAASDLATARIQVEGGALVTLGAPAAAQNLLANASFETPALPANSYKYVSEGGVGIIASWGTPTPTYVARCYPTLPNSVWISGGSVPDGNHVLIIQRHASVTQAFEVATAGFYQLAFDHFRRRGFLPHAITPSIDGTRLPTLLTVHDQFDTGHYTSVPFYLAAGTHVVGLLGCGTWFDASTMIDLAVVAPPSASEPCRALSADSSVSLSSGAFAVLNHTGDIPLAFLDDASGTVTGAGTWSASTHAFAHDAAVWQPSAPGDDVSALLSFAGDAAIPSALARHLLITNSATITGTGVTLSNLVATFDATPRITALAPATFNVPLALPVVASGDPVINNNEYVYPVSLFIDAEAAVTVNALTNHRYAFFVKTGPAAVTLAQPLNSSPNSNRAGAGFTVYDGELVVPSFVTNASASNEAFIHALPARTAALTLTQPSWFRGGEIVLGGDGSPSLNILATVTNSGRTLLQAPFNTLYVTNGATYSTECLARDSYSSDTTDKGNLLKTGAGTLDVRSVPPSTTFPGYLGQTVIRAGTVRISANDDPTGTGGSLGQTPASTPILLGDALSDAGEAPTLTLAGNASLVSHDIVAGHANASITLDSVSAARFAGTVTLNAPFTLSGPADAAVTFGALAANPSTPQPLNLDGIGALALDDATGIALDLGARTLALSPGFATAMAFDTLTSYGSTIIAEFSSDHDAVTASALVLSNLTFTLLYAGTEMPFSEPGTYVLFTAPSLAANPDAYAVSNPVSGFTYAFAVSGDSIELTITATGGTSATFWSNPASGTFSTAANWSDNAVPDASSDATLGSAITNNATVTLSAPAAVDALRMIHPEFSYTLAGDVGSPLTLSALSVDAGAHTVRASLLPSGSAPVAVTVAGEAALTFTNATLQGGMSGDFAATLAGVPALTLTGSGFTATHDGALSGTGTLTLNASGATQTLANRDALTQPAFAISAGTLALDAVQATQFASVSSGGTLATAAGATNGLTAFWYSSTDASVTNATTGRSALEAWTDTHTPAKIQILSGSGGAFNHSDLLPFAPQANNWLLVLRGTLTIPDSDDYLLYFDNDDTLLLTIDGNDLITRYPGGTGRVISIGFLSAGQHDILIGLSQVNGAAFLKNVYYSRVFAGKAALPTAWLTPLASLSTTTGNGALALAAGSQLRLTYGGSGYPQTGSSGAIAFNDATRPALAGDATSVFGKFDVLDILTLASASPSGFGGLFVNGAGRTVFTAPDILSASARLSLYPNASLALAANQTAAALSGDGALALGAPATLTFIHDDSDCGISADKVYTHALDFGSNTGNAVGAINGVPFLSTTNINGICTGTDGYTYGFTNMPPIPNGGNSSTTASGNLHKLLYDMNYNTYNGTFELTGLNPVKTYELRIYQRSWGGTSVNNNRIQLLGFIVNDLGRIDHQFSFSADYYSTPYYVSYRYRPSPSGKLRVRLTPYAYNQTLHLYGLTNEEVPAGAAAGSPSATLALAPAADAPAATYAGMITGNGAVSISGPGTQIFSGVNVSPDGLSVTGGAAALHDGAAVFGPVAVQAPGALHTSGAAAIGGLSGDGALALGLPASGDPAPSAARIVFLTDDASTGISPNKTYTHLYDLGNTASPTINGVALTKVTGNTATFVANPALSSHSGAAFSGSALGPVSTSSGLYTLLYDMCYVAGATPAPKNTTLTLSGLIPGRPYELRVYNRSWGWLGNRQQFVDFCSTADGVYRDAIYFNPDALAPNALVYRYVPEGTTLIIRVSNISDNNGWHLYGISNEDLSDPDAEAWGGSLTVSVPTNRTDAFAGTLAGPAPLVKSGPGTLLLTGSSVANGPFSIAAGAFGTAFTNSAALTSNTVSFALSTAYVWNWNASGAGGTLTAETVTLPETFTVIAGGTGQPPSRWPVIVSESAALTTPIENIALQGFSNSVQAEYSEDGRVLYLTNRRGTVFFIQ